MISSLWQNDRGFLPAPREERRVSGPASLRGEAREQLGGHLLLTCFERVAVGVTTGPPGRVTGGDAHVRMAELAAHGAGLEVYH